MVAELRDRRSHLERELELINVAIAALEKAWSIDACLAQDDALINKITADVARPVVANELKGLSYADAAERVLQRGQRQSVGTKTLIVRLETNGKRVKGKHPYRTLYRSLEKDSRFIRDGGKWGLAEWYPPPAAPEPNEAEKAAAKAVKEKRVVTVN